MRLIMKLFLCLCLMPLGVFCQDRVTKAMAGPDAEGNIKIVVAFVEPTDITFKMQSMIIEMSPIKNKNEQPASVFVDLTSTVRTLSSGEKKQKILQLRWDKTGAVEFRCDGKWKKQETANAPTGKIVETAKALFEIIPLDAKEPTDITLTPALEQKIIAVLEALNPQDFSCLREQK